MILFRTLKNKIQKFKQHSKGVATIEFALLSPILFLSTMGGIEVSLIVFTQSVLEGATVTAIRTTKVSPTTAADIIQNEVVRRGGGLLNASKLDVQIMGDPTSRSGVTYRASYNWNVVTPIMSKFMDNPFTLQVEVPALLEPV